MNRVIHGEERAMSQPTAPATSRTAIIETPDLGDRTYVVHDGQVAVVIDPQRDIDRVVATAGRLGVSVTHVLETHLHNDYVSGGVALAQITGADYLSHADEPVSHRRTGIRDGDAITTGGLTVRAIATPGHTLHHLSYVVEQDGDIIGVFSGGSMLYGTVGRPDLVSSSMTRQLAFAQHASVRRLMSTLPPEAPVYPTHGFGSLCAVSAMDRAQSTVGDERRDNPAARMAAEEFVDSTLSKLDAFPGYFRRMGPMNASMPPVVDLSPSPLVDGSDVRQRLGNGEWVIDVRPRADFARRHLAGSLGFDASGPFGTYVAWLKPPDTPLVLIADDAAELSIARRRLERVAVNRPAAVAIAGRVLGDADAVTSYRRATFAELLREAGDRPIQVVDVRGAVEWRRGHIAGAVHMPLHLLTSQAARLPRAELWVHCGTGHRSSIGASILQRAGHDVTHIDDSLSNADFTKLAERLPQPEPSEPPLHHGHEGRAEAGTDVARPISVGVDHG